jgi:hypothetical protein
VRVHPPDRRSHFAALALLAACAPMRNPPREASLDLWLLPDLRPGLDAGEPPRARVPRDAAGRPQPFLPDDDPVLDGMLRSSEDLDPERDLAGAVDFKEKDPKQLALDGRIDRSRQTPPPAQHLDGLLGLMYLAMEAGAVVLHSR